MIQDVVSVDVDEHGQMTPDRLSKWGGALRRLAFVYVSALIMVVGSERMFWYYDDADLPTFAELGAFYAIGVYALLWVMERFRTTSFWSFLLAVPVFGYVIEGVITPVLYEGGPTPVFPAYFTGWHGLLSVVVLWYGLRGWLIRDEWRPVLLAGVLLGVLWGLQATTMWLPTNLEDATLEADSRIRAPLDFLRYATRTTAVLVGGHWLLGHGLWVRRLGRSRVTEVATAITIGGIVVAWSLSIPWAGPMFAVLVGAVVWVLRRHRRDATGPGTLERLDGRISVRALAMLLPMPVVAAAVYAGVYESDPGEHAITALMYAIMATAALAGATMVAVSWIRVLRPARSRPRH